MSWSIALRQRAGNAVRSWFAIDGRGVARADSFAAALVVLNAVAVVLESIDEIGLVYATALFAFEAISIALFTLEYLLRTWIVPAMERASAPEPWAARARRALSPAAIIDLAAIVPFYLGTLTGLDLRMLRLLRLPRLLGLAQRWPVFDFIATVMRRAMPALAVSIAGLLVLLILSGSAMHYLERDSRPETFGSIPAAAGWALATLTASADGTASPTSVLGRLVAGAICVLGIGLVAVPAGVLASGATDERRRRRERYRELAREAWKAPSRSDALAQLAHTLMIDAEESDLILRAIAREARTDSCPHCGEPVEPIGTGHHRAAHLHALRNTGAESHSLQ